MLNTHAIFSQITSSDPFNESNSIQIDNNVTLIYTTEQNEVTNSINADVIADSNSTIYEDLNTSNQISTIDLRETTLEETLTSVELVESTSENNMESIITSTDKNEFEDTYLNIQNSTTSNNDTEITNSFYLTTIEIENYVESTTQGSETIITNSIETNLTNELTTIFETEPTTITMFVDRCIYKFYFFAKN
jgi:hypothetical protein